MKQILLFTLLVLQALSAQTQNAKTPKSVTAVRISEHIKIDGNLDEPAWQTADKASNFVELSPNNGLPEPENQKTEVRVLFDDTGVYFGAMMYDAFPDSILRQLTERDSEGVADFFNVHINPYNDARQEFIFSVSAAGSQLDAINTVNGGTDASMDAVWKSDVRITENGWVVEIKIPFSALRFPKNNTSVWTLNFKRGIRRSRTNYTWNYIPANEGNAMLFSGKLHGISDINPPVRLFIIPYASSYFNKFGSDLHHNFKAGADLKWGITENFTLDAILIPDFGQTTFDNVQYVLGPFEQQFEERRAFFTEGTDLFSLGNILYTRRIGELYSESANLTDNEKIEGNLPTQANLINAVKISGRTSDGWGIGVMNSFTDLSEINIQDTLTSESRTEILSPYTNFNVLVAEKQYRNNNSISIINTNVTRLGNYRDANVIALLTDNYTKNNAYYLSTESKFSSQYSEQEKQGYWLGGSLEKDKGKNRFGTYLRYVSENYEINDFGYNYYKNYSYISTWYSFRILQSTKHFNSMNISVDSKLQINNETKKNESADVIFNFNSQNKKNDYYGFGFGVQPFRMYDHYEPRTAGRYMLSHRNLSLWGGVSPNYNRRFVIDVFPSVYFKEIQGMWGYVLTINPIVRFSDRLSLGFGSTISESKKDYGYVQTVGNSIIIGKRNLLSYENFLQTSFGFSPDLALSLKFRHYQTGVDYQTYYILLTDGNYQQTADYQSNADFSYNNWNIDFALNWWYAPGSQISFLYRHTALSYDESYTPEIINNLKYLFQQTQAHTFSLRINYFLDYAETRNRLKKHK